MRALGALCALCLGIVAAEPGRVGWPVALGAVALLLVAALLRRRPLWLIAATVGLLRVAFALQPSTPLVPLPGQILTVRWPEPMGEDCHLTFDQPVLVVGPEALCDRLLPGDRVLVLRAARDGDRFAPMGEASGDDRLTWREAEQRVRIGAHDLVQLVDHSFRITRPIAAWRRAARRHFDRSLPPDEAGLVRALVLGERQSVAATDEGQLQRLGVLHVVSVSGLHLGLVVLALLFVSRRLLRRAPRLLLRVPLAAWMALTTLPWIVAYAAFTGMAPPTVRALVAAIILGLAPWVRRAVEPLTSLAVAAGVLLLDEPSRLYDVSLQLSVAATIGLLWANHRARGPLRFEEPPIQRWLRLGVWLSFGSTVFTLPLCAWHFGELVWTAPVGNLLIVPLYELVLLPLGLVVAGLAGLPAAAPIVKLLVYSSAALRELAIFARAYVDTAAAWAPQPTAIGVLAASLLAVLAVAACHVRRAVLLAIAVFMWIVWPPAPHLAATFLSVGHGDAALIETAEGTRVLIDGGGTLDPALDPGRRVVLPFLRRRGITHLDLVVVSHPHLDHVGGLVAVAEQLSIGELMTTNTPRRAHAETSDERDDDPRLPALERLFAIAAARGIPIRAPHHESLRDGTFVRALHPWRDDGQLGADESRSVNDNSIVLRVAWQQAALLFTGDIESDAEAEVCDSREPVTAQVLKIPHHGSATSSTERLLACVAPELAVLSGGRHNRFGLPKPAVIARYHAHEIPLARTDLEGHVRVDLDAKGAARTRRIR